MPVQMIELEEVQLIETSDAALEAEAAVKGGNYMSTSCTTGATYSC